MPTYREMAEIASKLEAARHNGQTDLIRDLSKQFRQMVAMHNISR